MGGLAVRFLADDRAAGAPQSTRIKGTGQLTLGFGRFCKLGSLSGCP